MPNCRTAGIILTCLLLSTYYGHAQTNPNDLIAASNDVTSEQPVIEVETLGAATQKSLIEADTGRAAALPPLRAIKRNQRLARAQIMCNRSLRVRNMPAQWQDFFLFKCVLKRLTFLYKNHNFILSGFKKLRGQFSSMEVIGMQRCAIFAEENRSKYVLEHFRNCLTRKGIHLLDPNRAYAPTNRAAKYRSHSDKSAESELPATTSTTPATTTTTPAITSTPPTTASTTPATSTTTPTTTTTTPTTKTTRPAIIIRLPTTTMHPFEVLGNGIWNAIKAGYNKFITNVESVARDIYREKERRKPKVILVVPDERYPATRMLNDDVSSNTTDVDQQQEDKALKEGTALSNNDVSSNTTNLDQQQEDKALKEATAVSNNDVSFNTTVVEQQQEDKGLKEDTALSNNDVFSNTTDVDQQQEDKALKEDTALLSDNISSTGSSVASSQEAKQLKSAASSRCASVAQLQENKTSCNAALLSGTARKQYKLASDEDDLQLTDLSEYDKLSSEEISA